MEGRGEFKGNGRGFEGARHFNVYNGRLRWSSFSFEDLGFDFCLQIHVREASFRPIRWIRAEGMCLRKAVPRDENRAVHEGLSTAQFSCQSEVRWEAHRSCQDWASGTCINTEPSQPLSLFWLRSGPFACRGASHQSVGPTSLCLRQGSSEAAAPSGDGPSPGAVSPSAPHGLRHRGHAEPAVLPPARASSTMCWVQHRSICVTLPKKSSHVNPVRTSVRIVGSDGMYETHSRGAVLGRSKWHSQCPEPLTRAIQGGPPAAMLWTSACPRFHQSSNWLVFS